MSSYTCAKLIKDIKQRINNDEYSDEVILGYINNAQMEILGEDTYPFLEKQFEYEEIGNGEAILPLDFQSVFQVLLDGHSLEYIPSERYANNSGSNQYTVFSNRIFFRSDDCRITHLDLLYLAKPLPLEHGEDEPCIPYEFSEILIFGALYRIEQAEGNFDYAEIHRRHQDELVLNMKMRYGLRQQSIKSRARLPFGMGEGD